MGSSPPDRSSPTDQRRKIFIPRAETYNEIGHQILGRVGQLRLLTGDITRESFLRELKDSEIVVSIWPSERLDRQAIRLARKLRIITRVGVGYENVDVGAATAQQVFVTFCPVHLATVADTVFALMLAVARKVCAGDRFCREGEWHRNVRGAMGFLGRDVHHKTLGIIGLGRIGEEVAKRAHGFSMRLLYSDVVARPMPEQALGAHRVDLDTLLAEADFVSVNCPVTDATRGLIGRKELARMKPTAFLINTARGPIIDQPALVEALKTGRIAGAGLDVYEREPIPPEDPLLQLPNVVVLPHLGAHTQDANRNLAEVTALDTIRILHGYMPEYLLNKEILKEKPLRPFQSEQEKTEFDNQFRPEKVSPSGRERQDSRGHEHR